MKATLKLLAIARDRRKTQKKKEKRKQDNSQTTAINTFFLFLFYIEKSTFCQKTYLEKPSLYCYI